MDERTFALHDSISGVGGLGFWGRSGKLSLDQDERRLSKLPTAVPSVKESMSLSRGAGGGSNCMTSHVGYASEGVSDSANILDERQKHGGWWS